MAPVLRNGKLRGLALCAYAYFVPKSAAEIGIGTESQTEFGGRIGAAAPPLPNLVVVIIDDWGWNDVGWHAHNQSNAKEIQTPNIDSLAASGIILDRFYVHQFCSPSRSALHTGRHPIHVNVLNSPLAAANTSDPVSGFAGIPRNMTALPAKLKTVGYSTLQAGKWHIGLATPEHTPHGRGYDKSLTYLDGANDYWDMTTGGWCGAGAWTDLWASTEPAIGLNNSWACTQANQPASCKYEDDLFVNFTLDAIRAHDPAVPLFAYYAPHSVHMPLEVPAAQLAKFSFITDVPRQKYAAMVNYVDAHVGAIVAELTAKGMWENTLLVLSADNGGPIYGPASGCMMCDGSAGANNFPHRGGKHSAFEGGVRVNALVSGGLLPPARRGQTEEGFIGIEDWYRTFLGLAGVDPTDERAAAAGLPPTEGFDMWPLLSGATRTSPRTEIWIGSSGSGNGDGPTPDQTIVQGLIRQDGWKLLHGSLSQDIWQGPEYPNATTRSSPWKNRPLQCGPASAPTCLFNVFDDPSEHSNQAAAQPDIVASMATRLAELQAGVFSPHRGDPSPLACTVSTSTWGGFVGPFLP